MHSLLTPCGPVACRRTVAMEPQTRTVAVALLVVGLLVARHLVATTLVRRQRELQREKLGRSILGPLEALRAELQSPAASSPAAASRSTPPRAPKYPADSNAPKTIVPWAAACARLGSHGSSRSVSNGTTEQDVAAAIARAMLSAGYWGPRGGVDLLAAAGDEAVGL